MPYTLHIQEEAQEDIQHAFDWYEEQSPGLGEKFLDEFYSTLSKIAAHPEYYGFSFGDFRDATVKQFPYLVYFKITGNKVFINYIRHKKRKPRL